MHNLKSWIWYAMNSSPNYKKEKYLKEEGATIQKEQLDIPKPLPNDHPLSKSLSISKILHSIQTDVEHLLDDEYEKEISKVEDVVSIEKKYEPKHNQSPHHDYKQSSITSDFFSAPLQASKSLNPVKPPIKQPHNLKDQGRQDSPTKARNENSPKQVKKPVGLLGTYIKPPVDNISDLNESDKSKINKSKIHKEMMNAAPTLKMKEHLTTLNQNKQLFKDIFVKPSEAKIDQLQKRESFFQSNIEEPTTEPETKPKRKLPNNGDALITKDLTGEFKELFNDDNNEVQPTPELHDFHTNEIIKIIMQIFSANKAQKGETFFNQQIQVQPPEGLNATVAAPLTPGGGWAPSIPNVSNLTNNTSLKDLTMRAKAGVQAGDIQKEAHMSFCLGLINEEKRKFIDAIKFYKRFFFCARLLDDPIGAALALNRLGVSYHKNGNNQRSLQFHIKHEDFSDQENVFAAYYNIGMSHRILGNTADSLTYFSKALEWANKRTDFESQCVTYGQMGITNLVGKNFKGALDCFKNCYEICQQMKNSRLQLDCLLCLAYICYSQDENTDAINYFKMAYTSAKALKEMEIAEQCLCNIGIAQAKVQFKIPQMP